MGFQVLGPIELRVADRQIDLGSGKQRAILAVLLLSAGRPCPSATVIDRVWDDSPPAQVRNALYSYISRIRKALRETGQSDYVLHQRNGGYVLDVPSSAVDVRRFEDALGQARAAADLAGRAALLREALDCWHGIALQDVAGRWAEETRQALARRRVGACAEWAKAMVDLGRHDEVVDVLEFQFAENPHAEPVAEWLMRVLHKRGRQAEALACYATLRERLANDLGVEPCQALQQLYLAILRDTTPPTHAQQSDEGKDEGEDEGNSNEDNPREESSPDERTTAEEDGTDELVRHVDPDQPSEQRRLAVSHRVRGTRISLSFALVAVLLLVVVVMVESSQADRQRERATVGELVASARNQLARDPELSLMLAVRAVEIEASESAQAVLAQALVECRVRRAWNEHNGAATALDINGVRVVSAGKDGTLRIWSLDGSTKPITVQAHSGIIRDVAFTTFGDLIASVGSDGSLRIWSADGNPIATMDDANVTAVAWEPKKGRQIAGAGKDGEIRVWPFDGRGPVQRHSKHTREATAVDWSTNGLLASVGKDGVLIIRELATGTERGRTTDGTALLDVDISPDGSAILTGSADGHIKIWPAVGDSLPWDSHDHRDAVNTVAFSKDGEYVITGGHDRTAHIRRADGQGDAVVLRGAAGPVNSATFTDDGHLVLTASDDGVVRAWDPSAKPELEVVRAHRSATADAVFRPDGRKVATVGLDGSVWLDEEEKRSAGMQLRSLAVSPDGRHVATAGEAGTVLTWPVYGKGDPLRIATGHLGTVQSVAFSPNGTTIATVGEDGAVRTTDLATGATQSIYQAGPAGTAVAYSRDGRLLASAHEDGYIRLRSTEGGAEPVLLHGSEDMRTIAFSPRGDFIAGAGNDGTIRVWPTTGGGEPRQLVGHYGRVNDLAFSEDGQYIASVGNDQKARMWKWAQRAEPVVYERHDPAGVTSVDFGAGTRLVTGRSDGTLDVWTCDVCVPAERLLSMAHERVTREFTPDERRLYLERPE